MSLDPFPILMYHALWPADVEPAQLERLLAADPQLSQPGARRYGLSDRLFDRHLAAIVRLGWTTPDRWAALDDPPEARTIWLTFDDGHRSNHDLALPALVRHGLRAAFFVTTDWIGTDGFMNEVQLRELRAAGMLIGSHGCSHRYLVDLPPDEVRTELVRSRERLESIFQEPISAISLPGGTSPVGLHELASEAGYRYVFTSRMGLASPSGDRLDWPRIALTVDQAEDFVERLLAGDRRELNRMARRARLRATVRRFLGTALYDRLRQAMLTGKKR